MKIHDLGGPAKGRHGNVARKPSQNRNPPTIRKVAADSVPFGESISTNGRTVFAAYNADGRLVAVAESVDAARRKYRAALWQRQRVEVKNLEA